MILSILLVILLIPIAYIDYKTQTIPDYLSGGVFLIGVIGLLVTPTARELFSSGAGACLGSGFFLLVAILTRGAIGGGDIKLMFGLGLIFGAGGIFIVMLMSCLIQAIIAIGVLLAKRKGMKEFIPFGPAIIMAALIQLFFGNVIITALGL